MNGLMKLSGMCMLAFAPAGLSFMINSNPLQSTSTLSNTGVQHHGFSPMGNSIIRQVAAAPDTGMGAVVEPAGNSSVIIKLNVPGQATKECWASALISVANQIDIPGFRKGTNIPESTIVSKIGEDGIKSEALYVLTDTVLKQAVSASGVNAIGQATLKKGAEELMKEYVPGEPLMMEIQVDVWPTIEYKGEYTGLEVDVQTVPFDQERYDQALMSLRKRQTILTEVDEPAQEGYSAIVDMEGFEKNADGSLGEPLPQLASGEQVEVILEPNRYTEGLYEGVLGMRAGETKEITVTLPARFSVGNLANKEAVFVVKCSAVKKRTLPEPNDEFANSIREGLTFEELEKEIIAAVSQENQDLQTQNRNRALEDALLEKVEIEIPETLVTEQAREKFAMMMADMKSEGSKTDEEIKEMISAENFEKYKEIVRKNVTRGLAATIALSDIAKRENLEVDELEVEDQLELTKNQARGDPNFDEEAVKNKIEAQLQKNMVLDWIAEKSTVNYV
mmetsp:Transcript_4515/g.6229  ORF Transcript_4515/g.6229 Transcript_4515/m.6229 type:complete len:506 (-) Transcript_4515:232-1749(-)|eukprot:CAMPEP_0117758994 /NCGR_PEP_ID=MMETSP0947-20121206/15739_1 /TAXON_ID=44440 /ORGANISM="Chattonella subsalsa, Strain CCMP2191" /LENGTH=505 /DNA_ID=CAMNT_0005579347 /DNA_START=56 /DNA_END=1573 /DNA_ORIENTATION=+